MPKISVMTMVFGSAMAEGKLTDVGMLEALEKMGFDGVELPAGRLAGDAPLLKAHAAYLAGSKLKVTCIDGGCNFIARDKAARAAGVDALKGAIEVAVTLKCPLVLAAGSHLSGDIRPEEGRRMTIDALNACMVTASEVGVALAIENFGVAPTLQCAAAHCLEILEGVPGLTFVFDTGNFYFCHEDPLENVKVLGAKTRHVHLKDWVKSATPEIADVSGAPLGSGLIPNEALVRGFLERGAVESFSLEVGAPGDKLEATRRDLETFRRWAVGSGPAAPPERRAP